jgi:hypothetical protein
LGELPSTFIKISEDENTDQITTFDVLHWLSKKLDAICPIQKNPKK